jgi:UDP-2,4-diacetamido-2,4,6-trideoxy-beta-L-altropyranose hydrolase
MLVAFRVDGAAFMGGGHVMRCLALADALAAKGVSCRFFSRHLTDAMVERIRGAGHDLTLLSPRPQAVEKGPHAPSHADWLGTLWSDDAADTSAELGPGCDWLVVDHYALDARWHEALRPKARHILVIDDLADRSLACDALLDPNYRQPSDDPFAARVSPECHRFSSPQMALLNPAFATAHTRARIRTIARHAFVYLGTASAIRHLPVIDALAGTDLTADLVTSNAVFTDLRLTGHPAVRSGRTRLHGPQPSLLPFMERADIAIGPVGTSTWERCTLGLPTLAITIALNQKDIAADLAANRIIDLLGSIEDLKLNDYAAGLQRIQQADWLQHLSTASLALCNGTGVSRMVDFLLAYGQPAKLPSPPQLSCLTMRKAMMSDARVLHDWRNHPTTRAMSIVQGPIDWNTHLSWLAKALADPRRVILIGLDRASGESIGTIRLDRSEDGQSGEISLAVSPNFRGRGFGLSILAAGMAQFHEAGHRILTARVLMTNPASQACFRRAGFSLTGCNATTLFFRHDVGPK